MEQEGEERVGLLLVPGFRVTTDERDTMREQMVERGRNALLAIRPKSNGMPR